MNKILFKINRSIEEIKREPNPSKEELELLGALAKIKSDLIRLHEMDVQRRTIEEAQKKLLLDTTRFIQDSWKVTEIYEEAYKEVMLLTVRRLDNESTEGI